MEVLNYRKAAHRAIIENLHSEVNRIRRELATGDVIPKSVKRCDLADVILELGLEHRSLKKRLLKLAGANIQPAHSQKQE